MQDKHYLIADIGGTNARFAFATESAPYFEHSETLQCAEFDNIDQALDAYLQSQEVKTIDGLYFAVAAPIQDEEIRFTNNHWVINAEQLTQRFGIERLRIINDFEAIAYSLAKLSMSDVLRIGDTGQNLTEPLPDDEDYTVAVLGPGTGLGAAALCQRDSQLMPVPTEGGHIGFSPANKLQSELLGVLQRKFGRVFNEQLVSGPGLVNIYESLCRVEGVENEALTAADIATAGSTASDAMCEKSMQLFFEILGQVTGDVVLALGAFEGAFIGGGICQRYPEQLANSKFRQGFENKSQQASLMESIPTWLVMHKNPGLLGSSVYARSFIG